MPKAVFALDPVSDRCGIKVIQDGERRAGYINLRTFIDTAEPDLRAAFSSFKAQGVTELIIDLRYNGGGLISIAELMGNLMGAGHEGHKLTFITFRESKASGNSTLKFKVQPESIAPKKIAFIATESTAAASEMLIDAFRPYLTTNLAWVGTNTYGKPVRQIALDRPECDGRLRAVALQSKNASRMGDYTGLATTVQITCAASDDLSRPFGDPGEAMIRTALDFLAERSCTPISARTGASATAGARVGTSARREALMPERPRRTIKREVPGTF